MSVQSAQDSTPLPEEDRARADCYALISRLFYGAPDVGLLGQLAVEPQAPVAETTGYQLQSLEKEALPNAYVIAFRALQEACREADAPTLRQEYDDLFIGAGKALVSPYTSGYAVPHAPDRHLLALREQLVSRGLTRRDSAFELEDHVSAVCDVMRWLIERQRPIEEQLGFFNEFVSTGLGAFCNAIDERSPPSFYRAVAGLARAFMAIEKEAFDLHTPE